MPAAASAIKASAAVGVVAKVTLPVETEVLRCMALVVSVLPGLAMRAAVIAGVNLLGVILAATVATSPAATAKVLELRHPRALGAAVPNSDLRYLQQVRAFDGEV